MFGKLKSFLFGASPTQPPQTEADQILTASAQVAPETYISAFPSTPIDEETAAEAVLVHREILDDALGVAGIEFFIRGELQDKLNLQRAATRRFLDGMLLDQLQSLRGKPLQRRSIWVQLAEISLLRLGSARLPPQARILLLADSLDRPARPDTRESILAMQEAGFQIWLDDGFGTAWFESLADIANGAILRLALYLPSETITHLKRCRERHRSLKLGAWDVTSVEDYDLARILGCQRFSGCFVTRREDWSGNELSPQMLNVASMINRVREESNYRAIAQVLKQDMAMSYRLLRYVNSAAQGLDQPISSIEQGLMILGQDQLDRWLTLVLLSGGALGDTALTEIALIRARFLELCGSTRLLPEECERRWRLRSAPCACLRS